MSDGAKDELSTIDLLLSESRAHRYDDTQRMVHLAELAHAAASQLSAGHFGRFKVADVQARALCELGNAYRVVDALDLAERALETALDRYEAGSLDPHLLALIADRTASLLCHRRRFAEALALLDRLHGFYLAAGETHLAAKTLITRGLYTENSGAPLEAVLITCRGLALLEPGRDEALQLAGVHNLLWCGTELGFFRLVRDLLGRVRPLYGAQRLNLLRLRWVEARVAAGLGEPAQAEELYLEAREGFLAARLVFPASMISLELLKLWLGEGRWLEARALSAELVPAFRALQAGREAFLSLMFLRRACEQEKAAEALHALTELDRQLRELSLKQP